MLRSLRNLRIMDQGTVRMVLSRLDLPIPHAAFLFQWNELCVEQRRDNHFYTFWYVYLYDLTPRPDKYAGCYDDEYNLTQLGKDLRHDCLATCNE